MTVDEIRVLVLAQDAAKRNTLAAACSNPEIKVVDALSPAPSVVAKLAREKIDAVVLENYGEAAYELAERIYISKTVLSLIMVSPDMSQENLEKAMNSGASRLISWDKADSELQQTIQSTVGREKTRASAASPTGSFDSRILSVFGTKGGVGKTMFSVNLGTALVARKKKVALVDLDLQFGDVGIFLDIEKADSIADVAEENAFDYALMKSYLFTHPSGIAGLCAPPSPEYAEIVQPEHVKRVVAGLKPNYDYVILDMPPAFQDNSIAGLEASTEIYFIINPDISTLRNAKVSLGVLSSLNLTERVHLVLNKNGCSNIKVGDIERILEKTVEFSIPNDQSCAVKAVNRGVPIVTGDKRSNIARAINAFADKNLLTDPASVKKRTK
jgi:pilus assembly protein CpaE